MGPPGPVGRRSGIHIKAEGLELTAGSAAHNAGSTVAMVGGCHGLGAIVVRDDTMRPLPQTGDEEEL